MPNWCNNSITIQGPTETLKTLWEEAKTSDPNGEFGLLNAMVPMPQELEGTTSPSKDGSESWYSWRVNNWGTKWDVSDEGLEFTDNGDGTAAITGWFDSAWAPPINAYHTWLDDNDNCDLYATYEEGGMDFAGIYDNGSDDYMDGVCEWAVAVLKGTCSLTDTPELFQKLDAELDLVESRSYLIDDEEEVTV